MLSKHRQRSFREIPRELWEGTFWVFDVNPSIATLYYIVKSWLRGSGIDHPFVLHLTSNLQRFRVETLLFILDTMIKSEFRGACAIEWYWISPGDGRTTVLVSLAAPDLYDLVGID